LNIEEVLKMWKEDSIIDDLKLDDTTIKMARIHSKYLELLTITKMRRKKKDLEYKTLLKDKWLYYNGKLSQGEMDMKGWEYDPFGGLNKPLKGDMNYYYDTDTDIQKAQSLLEYDKVLIETLEEIMSTIRWRHQNIGNIIKWRSFEAGV
jgi:hypothetical protein|tara:strand:- start:13924 stop:14370 length:447 start_codon:yes stop_codon:yes gene_type:complete